MNLPLQFGCHEPFRDRVPTVPCHTKRTNGTRLSFLFPRERGPVWRGKGRLRGLALTLGWTGRLPVAPVHISSLSRTRAPSPDVTFTHPSYHPSPAQNLPVKSQWTPWGARDGRLDHRPTRPYRRLLRDYRGDWEEGERRFGSRARGTESLRGRQTGYCHVGETLPGEPWVSGPAGVGPSPPPGPTVESSLGS